MPIVSKVMAQTEKHRQTDTHSDTTKTLPIRTCGKL